MKERAFSEKLKHKTFEDFYTISLFDRYMYILLRSVNFLYIKSMFASESKLFCPFLLQIYHNYRLRQPLLGQQQNIFLSLSLLQQQNFSLSPSLSDTHAH